jgi:hypothetical protein
MNCQFATMREYFYFSCCTSSSCSFWRAVPPLSPRSCYYGVLELLNKIDPIIHLDFKKNGAQNPRNGTWWFRGEIGWRYNTMCEIKCRDDAFGSLSSFKNLMCFLPPTYHLILSYLLFKAIPLSFSTRDDNLLCERCWWKVLDDGMLVGSHNIMKSCWMS